LTASPASNPSTEIAEKFDVDDFRLNRNYSPQSTQKSQRKIEYQKAEARVEKMLLNELTVK